MSTSNVFTGECNQVQWSERKDGNVNQFYTVYGTLTMEWFFYESKGSTLIWWLL